MATAVRFAVHIAEHACAAVLVGFSEHQATGLHEAHGWNLDEWPIWATVVLIVLLLATGAMLCRLVMFWWAHFEEEQRARLADQRRAARQRDAVQTATAVFTVGVAVALVFWQYFGGSKPPAPPAL